MLRLQFIACILRIQISIHHIPNLECSRLLSLKLEDNTLWIDNMITHPICLNSVNSDTRATNLDTQASSGINLADTLNRKDIHALKIRTSLFFF